MIGLRTLVLNNNFMPISLFPLHSIPAEDAVVRVVNGTCYVVAEYDRDILTPNVEMKWPSVIVRTETMKIKERVKLRRESLYYRDHGICVYCEKPLSLKEVTYDHVYPRARGGKHLWENVVCSCSSCNLKKGHEEPKGQWAPKFKPFKPNYFQLLSIRKKFPITIPDETWVDYIGDWEGEIKIA